jgi:hypothetical protein
VPVSRFDSCPTTRASTSSLHTREALSARWSRLDADGCWHGPTLALARSGVEPSQPGCSAPSPGRPHRAARAADGTFRRSIALNVPLECPTPRRPVDIVQRRSVEAGSSSPGRRSDRRNRTVATNPAGIGTTTPVHVSSGVARRDRRAASVESGSETVRGGVWLSRATPITDLQIFSSQGASRSTQKSNPK